MGGGQPASKKALKGDHAQHIHAHCDCEYAIRFDSRTTVAGYDPDKYLEQYYAYGGNINAMRRAQYAKNKDFINAQKHAAYAERKDRSGPVDVLEEYLRTAKPGQGSITYDKNYNRSNIPQKSKQPNGCTIISAATLNCCRKQVGFLKKRQTTCGEVKAGSLKLPQLKNRQIAH